MQEYACTPLPFKNNPTEPEHPQHASYAPFARKSGQLKVTLTFNQALRSFKWARVQVSLRQSFARAKMWFLEFAAAGMHAQQYLMSEVTVSTQVA